mmetsp:Transcript_32334/g.51554  ORF Transcript_32334/g.51554 Transcript_32334/m.51554 type:complete len:82 (-) Transcript_32334:220-465(-)
MTCQGWSIYLLNGLAPSAAVSRYAEAEPSLFDFLMINHAKPAGMPQPALTNPKPDGSKVTPSLPANNPKPTRRPKANTKPL